MKKRVFVKSIVKMLALFVHYNAFGSLISKKMFDPIFHFNPTGRIEHWQEPPAQALLEKGPAIPAGQ